VTHRLDVHTEGSVVVFELHGLLDEAALASLRAALDFARESGAAARIVLRAGSEVERSCLAALRALEAELVAESPYLASWLAREDHARAGPTPSRTGAAEQDSGARRQDGTNPRSHHRVPPAPPPNERKNR
jgi:hypothetical protein